MTQTPRTDAKERETRMCVSPTHAHYGWKFARKLERELATAQAFKSYVHSRLDDAGVRYENPESPHTAEGCRIGGRLDELIGDRDALRARIAELEKDAARYRWLRDNCSAWRFSKLVHLQSSDECDAAIDVAMQESKT